MMRASLTAAWLALALALDTVGAAAQTSEAVAKDNTCLSSLFDEAGPDPSEAWVSDERYEVAAVDGEDGRDGILHHGANSVRLSKETIPSLAPAEGGSSTHVDFLTIDARRIVVDMPIAIDDASITLHGEEISFSGRGAIAITKPPSKRPQSLTIVAGTLNLSDARRTPLLFETQDWLGETWPTAETGKRTVRLMVEAIIPRRNEDPIELRNLTERPARYIHNASLDRGRSSRLGAAWQQNYDVEVGPEGLASYQEALGREMIWPNSTAAKVMRHFSRSPYDPRTVSFLNILIDQYEPSFAQRQNPRSLRPRWSRLEL